MNYLKFILLGLCLNSIQFGQGTDYAGPNDPAGDIEAEREGYMNGNRVYLYYQNTTELSSWPKPNVSKWPNNPDGTKMLDGVGLLVGARVYIEDDLDLFMGDDMAMNERADQEGVMQVAGLNEND